MFRLDVITNSITAIERTSFTKLSYGERKHLQEWIAGSPECLGEDLLIIQKEFDGFDETRERLDLLALDKDGQLVVIEKSLSLHQYLNWTNSGKDLYVGGLCAIVVVLLAAATPFDLGLACVAGVAAGSPVPVLRRGAAAGTASGLDEAGCTAGASGAVIIARK